MHKSSYKMGGIGALYELCAPSSTPHSSFLTPHFFVAYRVTVESMKIMQKKQPHGCFFMLLSPSDE